MNWNRKIVALGLALIVAGAALWIARERRQPRITYSEFVDLVTSGKVASAVITSGAGPASVTARLKAGAEVRTVLPASDEPLLAALREQHVRIEIRNARASWWNATPFGVLLILWVVLLARFRRRRA